jgi:hypothetical protein
MTKLCLLATALLFAAAARAHHSAAVHFVTDETVSVSGAVEEFRIQNPHSVVFVRVTDEPGVEAVWVAEWAPASVLRRIGMQGNSIKPGDRVTIAGSPARDGSKTLLLRMMTFADGRPPIGGGSGVAPAESEILEE